MTNVAGAICIGQVVALYMTIGGDPTRRSKRCYSSSRLFRPVCASRRVASCRVEYFMHFTYFAYKTHADVKPATIRALDYIAGTDELDVSNNNVQWLSGRECGDCLLSAHDWKWFGSPKECLCFRGFATITALPKLRTHDDINGIPVHFTSISKLDFGSITVGIE